MTTGGALLLLLVTGGLRVETGSPEALCPDLGQVREAARARLGDIEASGDWLASYTLVHRPDATQGGDVVRLELTDPAGRLRLRRDLVRAGESCAALARALVVVLEAYFRHPAAAADDADGRPEAIMMAKAPASRGPAGLLVDLSGGWSAGWAGSGGDRPASPVVALGLRAALVPAAWWAGIEGAWMLGKQTQTIGAETATLRSYALRAFLARDLVRSGGIEVLAGPELMLALDQADAATLLEGTTKARASWGGGVRGQLQIRLAERASLSIATALDYAPAAWGGSFVVGTQTGEREIFAASRWRLLLGAGLSVAVF